MHNRTTRSEFSVVRLLTGGIAVITVLSVLSALTVVPNMSIPVPGWYAALTVVALGIPIVAGVIALSARLGTLKRLTRLNALTATSHLVLVLAWGLVTLNPPGVIPWLLSGLATSVISAHIVWGPVGGWCALISLSTIVQALRVGLETGAPAAFVNDMHIAITALLCCVLTGYLLAASRARDRAASLAEATESRLAADRARESVQASTEAMVHDEVLATLLLAGQNSPAYREAIASQASAALRLIDDLGGEESAAGPVPVESLILEAEAITRRIDENASFVLATEEPASIPGDAASALLSALSQAMINSVTHAGRGPVNRSVMVSSTGGGIDITVADDGDGYDAAQVPGDRMGIAVSIVGRLAYVPGAIAHTDSRPGDGASVSLSWSPPREVVGGEADMPSRRIGLDPGARLAIAFFLLIEWGLAAVTGLNSASPWTSLVALAGTMAAFSLLGWRDLGRPTLLRSALVVAAVIASSAVVLVPVERAADLYPATWYVTGNTLLMVILVLRDRWVMAWLGLALMASVILVAVVVHGDAIAAAATVLARPIAIFTVGSVFSGGITWMLRTTSALRSAEIEAAKAQAFGETRIQERRARSQHLSALIGPVLDLLADGRALTDQQARECLAVEGRLRDYYRGGRLARTPLADVALDARRRGVDVRLLDDGGEQDLAERDLDLIAAWMADRLSAIHEGQFIGRLLPPGREDLATVVANDGAALVKSGFAAQ